MAKRQQDKIKTIDEKARLMSYASLTLNGLILGLIIPMMQTTITNQAENTTKLSNADKTFIEFSNGQDELKKDVKEIRKDQGEIKGEQKAINAKLDMLISMAMKPDSELIRSSIEDASSKREIKKKEFDKSKEKIATENSDVYID